MKKILLSAVALLAFGIASAQTDPKTPPVAPTPPSQVTPEQKKAKADANVQDQVPETSDQRRKLDNAEPRKDELKTRDHVKSTPDPEAVKNDNDKKAAKRSKTKKSS